MYLNYLLFAKKFAACDFASKVASALFTLYLNNQLFVPYNFSIFEMYSSRAIGQCNLYTKKLHN